MAPNASWFTLSGTYTHLVGSESVAIIDPGPDHAGHRRAVVEAVEGARELRIVLTHDHRDHSGGARTLQSLLGCGIWGPEGVAVADRALTPGKSLATDDGELRAVASPGHAERHLAFHWTEGRAVFVGDLLLGEGATTWVGGYSGCVADYLESLERLRGIRAEVLYPAHGPPLTNPARAIDRFDAHRRARIDAVRRALRRQPDATVDELALAVYGDFADEANKAVRASVAALAEYVREAG